MFKSESIQKYLFTRIKTKFPKIIFTLEDMDMQIIFNTNPLDKLFSDPEYINIFRDCKEDSITNIKNIIKRNENELKEAYNRYYKIIEDILKDKNREYDFENIVRELNKYKFYNNKDYLISVQLKPKLGIMTFKEDEKFKLMLGFMQKYGDFKECINNIVADDILLGHNLLIEVRYKDFSAIYKLCDTQIKYKFLYINAKQYEFISKHDLLEFNNEYVPILINEDY